jgi:hypothetical protein
VLDVNTRSIESVALVTVLFAASFTQTVIVDTDDPFAGMGLGDALATRCVAGPAPANEIVAAAGVSPVEVAVAVHASATASAIVNFTVVPVDDVLAEAGLPEPPAGVVVVTAAPHRVVVLGWVIVTVMAVGPKTWLPPASWTWMVTSQLEPAAELVVGVLLHVLPVIMSLLAGPAAMTDAVAEPDVRPGTDAVTVQVPGAPVVVSVDVVLLAPAPMVAVVGETLQMPALSTENVTVRAVCVVAVTPLASFSVAVTDVVRGLPDGNALEPRVTPTEVGVPAAINVTFVMQPGRRAVAAESWSVPVAPVVGCVNATVARPLAVFFVDDAPAAPPSRLPSVPACDSVMARPLSVVTV